MKKTIIGSVLLLSGVVTSISILISAALYIPSITSWSGHSKLWYAIFGAKTYGNEVSSSLDLGAPFIIGIILFAVGLLVLGIEYFKKES